MVGAFTLTKRACSCVGAEVHELESQFVFFFLLLTAQNGEMELTPKRKMKFSARTTASLALNMLAVVELIDVVRTLKFVSC